MTRRRNPFAPSVVLLAATALGLAIFTFGPRLNVLGSRLTDPALVVTVVLGFSAIVGGAAFPRWAWAWGIGLGVGTRLAAVVGSNQPLEAGARQLAILGVPQPLPLPLGLATQPMAQWFAGSLVLVGFTLVTAFAGWIMSRALAGVPA